MKRFLIILGLLSVLSYAAFTQSSRTSRTNSKPHDRSATIGGDTATDANKQKADKSTPDQDMDKNNPAPGSTTTPPPKSGDKDQKKDK